ncbi:hypothetical protein T459_17364 [Capsicum annuum]|uniref:Uncharacterized protein n=1 Tax=Capsicum annuum TaxID=4072 RepID=A0A2G2ZBD9_CAPAN|nr:hypothetical protein FXO37_24904 [Capsicum annuum]PHT79312.1 hypothetical protein T459_17364 [Capsicum annuum]
MQNEASTQIVALTEENKLKLLTELLQTEKGQLDLVIESGKQESAESLAEAENQNSELSQNILDQELKLKEQEEARLKFGGREGQSSATDNEKNLLREEKVRLQSKLTELEFALAEKVEEHGYLQKKPEDVQNEAST